MLQPNGVRARLRRPNCSLASLDSGRNEPSFLTPIATRKRPATLSAGTVSVDSHAMKIWQLGAIWESGSVLGFRRSCCPRSCIFSGSYSYGVTGACGATGVGLVVECDSTALAKRYSARK